MADQKISELTNILGSDVGAGDEFVVVDSSANETKAITTLELRTAIGNGDFTVTGDLTVQGTTITVDSATAQTIDLGDNDKMQFGDGNDLQIYHDGLHSYIQDAGTGRLHFQSNSYVFYNAAGTERGLDILENDEVRLYFDGSEKLATTSTGIDVTGTAVTDGVTVAGNLSVDGGTIKLDGNYPVGSGNVGLGDAALDDGSLSGDNNTAIGSLAMTANTTGTQNAAFGQAALDANTTGNNNTALGRLSVSANSTGGNNTGVGHSALASNTTASNNTAVGYQAGYSNTTGEDNVSLGRLAAYSNTTGQTVFLLGLSLGMLILQA